MSKLSVFLILGGTLVLGYIAFSTLINHKMVCEEVVKESEVTSDGVKIKKSNVRIHCEEFLGVEK